MNRVNPTPSRSAAPLTLSRLLIGDYAGELANYLQYRTDPGSAVALSFQTVDYSVLNEWDRRQPLEDFATQRGFTAIFVQPRIMAELRTVPAAKTLLEDRTQYRRVNSLVDRDWGLYALLPPK